MIPVYKHLMHDNIFSLYPGEEWRKLTTWHGITQRRVLHVFLQTFKWDKKNILSRETPPLIVEAKIISLSKILRLSLENRCQIKLVIHSNTLIYNFDALLLPRYCPFKTFTILRRYTELNYLSDPYQARLKVVTDLNFNNNSWKGDLYNLQILK